MFSFKELCCAAQDAGAQAAELVSAKAAEARDAAKSAVDSFALSSLKEALEGTRTQEWEAPDVFIEILQVEMGAGVEVASITNFHLKGLKVKCKVDIVGTSAQLAGMVAAGGAKKAAKKVGEAEAAITEKLGRPSLGIGSYIAGALGSAKDKLASSASSGTEIKSSEFDFDVDLEKVLGVEEVKTTAKIVGTSSDALAKYMANSSVQAYAEDAISRKATNIVTDWQNRTITAKKAEIGDKMAKIGEKASEVATAADDLAKAKGLK